MDSAPPSDCCATCRHFRPDANLPPVLGRCWRYPPMTVNLLRPNPQRDPNNRPPEEPDDWVVREYSSNTLVARANVCGEHLPLDGPALPLWLRLSTGLWPALRQGLFEKPRSNRVKKRA